MSKASSSRGVLAAGTALSSCTWRTPSVRPWPQLYTTRTCASTGCRGASSPFLQVCRLEHYGATFLVKFNLILKAAQSLATSKSFWRLCLGTAGMLAVGYAGEPDPLEARSISNRRPRMTSSWLRVRLPHRPQLITRDCERVQPRGRTQNHRCCGFCR